MTLLLVTKTDTDAGPRVGSAVSRGLFVELDDMIRVGIQRTWREPWPYDAQNLKPDDDAHTLRRPGRGSPRDPGHDVKADLRLRDSGALFRRQQ